MPGMLSHERHEGDVPKLQFGIDPVVMTTEQVVNWMNDKTGDQFRLKDVSQSGVFAYECNFLGQFVGWRGMSEVERVFAVTSSTDAYMLSMDHGAGMDLRVGSRLFVAAKEKLTFVRMDYLSQINIQAKSIGEGFMIPVGLMNKAIENVLDRSVPTNFEFTPELDLSDVNVSKIVGLMKAFRNLFESTDAVVSDIALCRFEDLISNLIVTTFHHSLSHDVELSRSVPVAPRQVKRAMEFARANAGRAITSADMASAAGVGLRALQGNFQSFLGVTPIQYLKKIRLEGARQDILLSSPQTKVTSIAKKWGFVHMGRFSVDYQSSFGVSPSEDKRNSQSSI